MTFLVSVVTRQAIVLAADTLVGTSTTSGKSYQEHDWKLFAPGGRFGVMTHGCGPGDDVPAIIEAFPLTPGTGTRRLAKALLRKFRSYSPPPQMGLYVAGWDKALPRLLHVNVEANVITPEKVPVTRKMGVTIVPDPKSWISPTQVFGSSGCPDGPVGEAEAVEIARKMVEIAAHMEPSIVSLPADCLIVRRDGVQWISRVKRHSKTSS